MFYELYKIIKPLNRKQSGKNMVIEEVIHSYGYLAIIVFVRFNGTNFNHPENI
jgi:hypothetical protein